MMDLVLFRHAEKESLHAPNPKLSANGLKQAQNLAQLIFSKQLPSPDVLLSSPKTRAQQTFAAASEHVKIQVQVNALLDERALNESALDFRRRVQELMILIQMDFPQARCIYLCTHFDWVEEFLTVIESSTDLSQPKYQHWSSGQWMWFKKSELWDVYNTGRLKA